MLLNLRITLKRKQKQIISLNGIVVNCDYLRVRSKPSLKAEEIVLIPKDSKVSIDSSSKESKDFYKVLTPDGTKGYCVKEYIKLL